MNGVLIINKPIGKTSFDIVRDVRKEYNTKDYSYDGIYDMNSTQEQIFNCSAQPVIDVS